MTTKVNKHCEIISNHLFGIIKQKALRVMSANTWRKKLKTIEKMRGKYSLSSGLGSKGKACAL